MLAGEPVSTLLARSPTPGSGSCLLDTCRSWLFLFLSKTRGDSCPARPGGHRDQTQWGRAGSVLWYLPLAAQPPAPRWPLRRHHLPRPRWEASPVLAGGASFPSIQLPSPCALALAIVIVPEYSGHLSQLLANQALSPCVHAGPSVP